MKSFSIPTPKEFSFDLCLDYLKRSPREILHRCEDRSVVKLLQVGPHSEVLFRVSSSDDKFLCIDVLNGALPSNEILQLENYISQWFDLKTNLKPFYAMARKDELLRNLVKKYFGYRIVGQPDLFESLVWAVLGQQINLQFAYTLKQRFVEKFGKRLVFDAVEYFMFPQPETVAVIGDEQLLPLQFSRQKSKYVVSIAEAFASGNLSKEKIQALSFADAKEMLMKIKGIGNWTANYALMKTFHYPDAFPLEDAGLHNAIKNLKSMKAKPTLEQVKRIFKKYKGWEAYATLYFWKSL
jgi:DNA-3-methyladenine glycosylase II